MARQLTPNYFYDQNFPSKIKNVILFGTGVNEVESRGENIH